MRSSADGRKARLKMAQPTLRRQGAHPAAVPPARQRGHGMATYNGTTSSDNQLHTRGVSAVYTLGAFESFSLYGAQSVLLYFLYFGSGHGGLALDKDVASAIVGSFTGLIYLCGLISAGMSSPLSDAGRIRLIQLSACVLGLGYGILALAQGRDLMLAAIVLVSLASGAVKTLGMAQLGAVHDDSGTLSTQREAAFVKYYAIMNMGAFAGPLAVGWVWHASGFSPAFWLCSALAVAAAVAYARSTRGGDRPAGTGLAELANARTARWALIGLAVLALFLPVTFFAPTRSSALMAVVVALAITSLFAYMLSSRRSTPAEKRNLKRFSPAFLGSVCFWCLYQQQYTVLALFVESRVDLSVFGLDVPPGWVQSVSPLAAVLVATLALMSRERAPKSVSRPYAKISAGLLVMALGYVFFLWASTSGGLVPLHVIVAVLVVFSVSEILVGPIVQSMSTSVSGGTWRTQMSAMFFLSVSLGSAGAGVFAQLYVHFGEHVYFATLISGSLAVSAALLVSHWLLAANGTPGSGG
ncbi:oligopeptide:H+ symporter [Streptomyces sp. NPDC057623]|uniref:oligopeptide:H+ symporter n=1 Tax=Streptomyces sp. NPDC057623 TaxID=3346187 RepID=UPI0036BBE420